MDGKAALVEHLRASGREAVKQLRALPEPKFDEGRYENGWNARQILAHLATVEWTIPRLIALATNSAPGWPLDGPTPKFDMDAYNTRQVEKRRAATVEELIREFKGNRDQTVAALSVVDESLLPVPIVSSGGAGGALGEVLRSIGIDHLEAHLRDILRGNGKA